MAVVFSEVTLTTESKKDCLQFLVGGNPREFNDLKGWTFFDNYLKSIDEDIKIKVHADAYIYGEGERVAATPCEVAYMYKRIEGDPNFLNSRCTVIDKTDFTFLW